LIGTLSFRGGAAAYDRARSIAIHYDTTERPRDLLEIWALGAQPAQSRLHVYDIGGDWLIHFMSDRGGEVPDGRDAIRVGEFHLHLAVPSLTLARFGFRPLSPSDIQHESDDTIAFEPSRTDQNGNAATVFPNVLFLERLNRRERVQLRERQWMSLVPFRGRNPCPMDASGGEILMIVSQHVEERIVGLENFTFEIQDEGPDDIRVEQPPDLGFAFTENLLRPVALCQVEHEGDMPVFSSLNARFANEHGHAAAVLPEILFLEWLSSTRHRSLGESLCGTIAPFRRRQIHPADKASQEILASVPYEAKQRVIGFDHLTVARTHADPDNVGVDQPPDLGFALFEIAVQTVFSSEVAACEARSFSTAIRAGAKARAVRLFSR
jgi:hypothetical protein